MGPTRNILVSYPLPSVLPSLDKTTIYDTDMSMFAIWICFKVCGIRWPVFSYRSFYFTVKITRGCTLKDRKLTKSLLEKYKLLSVNQLAANIRLIEAWKSVHIKNYPVQLEPNKKSESQTDRELRPSSTRQFNENSRTKIGEHSFCCNAAKLWNQAPLSIKEAKTLHSAKREIKKFCLTFL